MASGMLKDCRECMEAPLTEYENRVLLITGERRRQAASSEHRRAWEGAGGGRLRGWLGRRKVGRAGQQGDARMRWMTPCCAVPAVLRADAQPNTGDFTTEGLNARMKANAVDNIFLTLIGELTIYRFYLRGGSRTSKTLMARLPVPQLQPWLQPHLRAYFNSQPNPTQPKTQTLVCLPPTQAWG